MNTDLNEVIIEEVYIPNNDNEDISRIGGVCCIVNGLVCGVGFREVEKSILK